MSSSVRSSSSCHGLSTYLAPHKERAPLNWKIYEDKILGLYAAFYNGKPCQWSRIAKWFQHNHNLDFRGKHYRERYVNHLDPALSQERFSEEEADLVTSLYSTYGTKFAFIKKELLRIGFGNHSDNKIKNFVNSGELRKKPVKRKGASLKGRVGKIKSSNPREERQPHLFPPLPFRLPPFFPALEGVELPETDALLKALECQDSPVSVTDSFYLDDFTPLDSSCPYFNGFEFEEFGQNFNGFEFEEFGQSYFREPDSPISGLSAQSSPFLCLPWNPTDGLE